MATKATTRAGSTRSLMAADFPRRALALQFRL